MLIKEIILENFMSYEYARIPLKPGINIICGPNGAGKSSILVGISVALGQSYTERSKRLSDLIRRGRDIGRVTLVLDNSRRKGRRPVRRINKDEIYLTRVLRRDGKYWFEIDNAHATKAEVTRLLSHFKVDPDNMLIIMHQDMAEQFIILSPQEKLRLIEAATGLESYRRNVLEARRKLSRILSQEDSLKRMLESAEQTLAYWREQYERFQERRQLEMKRRFLERELGWAEVSRIEADISRVQGEIERRRNGLKAISEEIRLSRSRLESLQNDLKDAKGSWRRLLYERIRLEREYAKHEFNIENARRIIDGIQGVIGNADLNVSGDEGKTGIRTAELDSWVETLKSNLGWIWRSMDDSRKRIEALRSELSDIAGKLEGASERIEGIYDEILNERVNLAILLHRREEAEAEIHRMEAELRGLRRRLSEAIDRAERRGSRIATHRSPDEILDEIRMVDGRISAMADIPGDVERMYESYSRLYLELQEKMRVTAENKEKALGEVERRMVAWRRMIRDLLLSVSSQYERILSQASGTGYVRLINDHDIEEAGVEICVGFKGSKPIPLNIYSQSGGERSTAVMAFLLSLQRHIRSPFRAVDEYDVHMDPRNREVIAKLLISAAEDEDVQYLAITPNQMYFEGRNVHMITVQNVGGRSMVMEVK